VGAAEHPLPQGGLDPRRGQSACEGKDGKFDPAKRYGAFLPAGWRAGAGAWEEDAAELKQAGPLLLNTGSIPIPHLDGSYEELSADLDSQARPYLRQAGIISPDGGEVTLLGTFDGYGVLVVRRYYSYGDRRNTTAYRVAWKTGEGGEPAWDGAPEPVDLVVTVEPAPAGAAAGPVAGRRPRGRHSKPWPSRRRRRQGKACPQAPGGTDRGQGPAGDRKGCRRVEA
jgi:hypothetical protein